MRGCSVSKIYAPLLRSILKCFSGKTWDSQLVQAQANFVKELESQSLAELAPTFTSDKLLMLLIDQFIEHLDSQTGGGRGLPISQGRLDNCDKMCEAICDIVGEHRTRMAESNRGQDQQAVLLFDYHTETAALFMKAHKRLKSLLRSDE